MHKLLSHWQYQRPVVSSRRMVANLSLSRIQVGPSNHLAGTQALEMSCWDTPGKPHGQSNRNNQMRSYGASSLERSVGFRHARNAFTSLCGGNRGDVVACSGVRTAKSLVFGG